MEIVKALHSYCLTKDGISLTMQYGRNENAGGNKERWRFYGSRIPMPVRSGTWFQGLSVREMLNWLSDNGWELHCRVNLCSGIVYPICKGNEIPDEEVPIKEHADDDKGNETPSQEEINNVRDERALREAVVFLYNNSRRVTAARLYRYFKQCTLSDAVNAIREMATLDEESNIC